MTTNSKEYAKIYYETNKKHIKKLMRDRSQKTTHCEVCNCDITVGSSYLHRKSKKHIKNTEATKNDTLNKKIMSLEKQLNKLKKRLDESNSD